MNCSCPKCNAAIEMDHAGIPDDGTPVKCPSCNAQLKIVKESYARVAYGRLAEKSCTYCGEQLGSGISCSRCGAPYPDFFVAADPAALKRKARELRRQQMLATFRGIEFSLPSFKGGPSRQSRQRFATEVSKRSTGTAGTRSTKLPMLVACLVAILVISGGGYTVYAQKKEEKLFVDTYFKALYGVKTGSELSVKVHKRILTEWKAAQGSGSGFSPLTTTEEISRLTKVKSEVDKIITTQLAKPPEKFASARESLSKLNDDYTKMHTLALSPPNSFSALSDSSEKSSADFEKTAKALKSGLPPEMTEELKNAKVKYKNLREF